MRYWTQLPSEQIPPSQLVELAGAAERAGFESLNESPCGMDWPDSRGQLERLDEALEIITRLLDSQRFDFHGKHFRTKGAYLHALGRRRPPVYVSAFGPRAAGIAARHGDGLWTLANPREAPRIMAAYRNAREDAGKPPGEIILQAGMSWAESDEQALEGARVWKGAQPPEFFREDWHEPAAMYAYAEELVSDDDLRESMIISADPNEHVERLREIEQMGASVLCIQNASGADPGGAFETYGREVLPRLRAGAYAGA